MGEFRERFQPPKPEQARVGMEMAYGDARNRLRKEIEEDDLKIQKLQAERTKKERAIQEIDNIPRLFDAPTIDGLESKVASLKSLGIPGVELSAGEGNTNFLSIEEIQTIISKARKLIDDWNIKGKPSDEGMREEFRKIGATSKRIDETSSLSLRDCLVQCAKNYTATRIMNKKDFPFNIDEMSRAEKYKKPNK